MDEIKLEKINKHFGEKQVLSDLSLAVPAGARVCLTGASGSGKTTLLNIILGRVKPDSGTVSGVPQKIAAVFQEDRLPEYLSAFANVRFVTGKSMPAREITALLGMLGLEGSEYCRSAQLSGGMKRRAAVARALAAESELVIMDEPFSGLDAETKSRVIEVINRLTEGKTFICVTHDPADAAALGATAVAIR